ncbi:MAG: ABC transporter ATP-binding protein [Chloroflexi bacterium AL-W]|nr:ABC transporter ATP-binding protein [Chloroflexi bacterium AL-N1]NOK68934.1 ABC transporter ATP-binding protein [Chloroflexi bacterium AL-N10]NOK76917.1 ABC transporter ATP-binding protein [Chloroflexi bacterium AL-N5]NOK82695.1 ABC transporter ATP-binding protein [Chloroflexi bacterium AL-W]NOK90774.1 ABC transporter ATP-binding protein [Chloroflexi bacterium AL-N15]
MIAEHTTNTNVLTNTSSQIEEADLAISIRDVSKMYRIYDRPQDRLRQMIWRGKREFGRQFWALQGVTLDIKRGERVGIIGRNGSGKSTLLQIIAGTLAPTTGKIVVGGRVGALLELGSGFNLEFTGRENIFMNGSVLGMHTNEIEERFDEIASFADIGDFIDQPVKLYSSGMFVRLAFAITTCMDPDILIIDEALAVGDIFFRQKCYRRLEALCDTGVSILLVSHSMMDIEQFCDRALLLNNGVPLFQGPGAEAVKHYLLLEQGDRSSKVISSLPDEMSFDEVDKYQNQNAFWPSSEAFFDLSHVAQVTNEWAKCTGVALCNNKGQPCHVFQQGEIASFFYEFEIFHDMEVPIGGLVIHSDKGILVHGKSTLEHDSDVPHVVPKGSRLRFQQDISLEIAIGEYTFEPGFATMSYADYQERSEFSYIELDTKIMRLCHLPAAGNFIITPPQNRFPIQLLHHGVANLFGECTVTIKASPENVP